MIKDKIKTMAKNYAHDIGIEHEFNGSEEIAYNAFMACYNTLSESCCIVEREKVIEAYKDNLQKENDIYSKGFDDYVYTYRNEQLTDIFGTSMFNQNNN